MTDLRAAEWVELWLFWLLSIVTVSLAAYLVRQPARPIGMRINRHAGWRSSPEIMLLTLGLPLESLWEIAQFPLYEVWHENNWSYILYGLVHCTLGDLLILLATYELVALAASGRDWYLRHPVSGGALFTLLGLGYTIYSEYYNVRIQSTWGYTEHMPIVPGIEIGGTPFLQWLLIPFVLVSLMRLLRGNRP